jgi:hypothetical protein
MSRRFADFSSFFSKIPFFYELTPRELGGRSRVTLGAQRGFEQILVSVFRSFGCGKIGFRTVSEIRTQAPIRYVRRKGAGLLSCAESQTARAISGYAQYAFLISLQMGSIN